MASSTSASDLTESRLASSVFASLASPRERPMATLG